jgi:hypothetical protein
MTKTTCRIGLAAARAELHRRALGSAWGMLEPLALQATMESVHAKSAAPLAEPFIELL